MFNHSICETPEIQIKGDERTTITFRFNKINSTDPLIMIAYVILIVPALLSVASASEVDNEGEFFPHTKHKHQFNAINHPPQSRVTL